MMPLLCTLNRMITDAYPVPRRSERKQVRKAIVLMIESDGQEVHQEGTAVDISEHGARVEAEAALTPGQTISLVQPDDPTHALRCLVVWSGEVGSDGRDQAGLEFLDPLPTGLEN
jgi:PilZ domain